MVGTVSPSAVEIQRKERREGTFHETHYKNEKELINVFKTTGEIKRDENEREGMKKKRKKSDFRLKIENHLSLSHRFEDN